MYNVLNVQTSQEEEKRGCPCRDSRATEREERAQNRKIPGSHDSSAAEEGGEGGGGAWPSSIARCLISDSITTFF